MEEIQQRIYIEVVQDQKYFRSMGRYYTQNNILHHKLILEPFYLSSKYCPANLNKIATECHLLNTNQQEILY
jgi:hypothetical protein